MRYKEESRLRPGPWFRDREPPGGRRRTGGGGSVDTRKLDGALAVAVLTRGGGRRACRRPVPGGSGSTVLDPGKHAQSGTAASSEVQDRTSGRARGAAPHSRHQGHGQSIKAHDSGDRAIAVRRADPGCGRASADRFSLDDAADRGCGRVAIETGPVSGDATTKEAARNSRDPPAQGSRLRVVALPWCWRGTSCTYSRFWASCV